MPVTDVQTITVSGSTTTTEVSTSTSTVLLPSPPSRFHLLATSGDYSGQYARYGDGDYGINIGFSSDVTDAGTYSIDSATSALTSDGIASDGSTVQPVYYYPGGSGSFVDPYPRYEAAGLEYLLCHIDPVSLALVCANGQFNALYTCNGGLGIVKDGVDPAVPCGNSRAQYITLKAIVV